MAITGTERQPAAVASLTGEFKLYEELKNVWTYNCNKCASSRAYKQICNTKTKIAFKDRFRRSYKSSKNNKISNFYSKSTTRLKGMFFFTKYVVAQVEKSSTYDVTNVVLTEENMKEEQ